MFLLSGSDTYSFVKPRYVFIKSLTISMLCYLACSKVMLMNLQLIKNTVVKFQAKHMITSLLFDHPGTGNCRL